MVDDDDDEAEAEEELWQLLLLRLLSMCGEEDTTRIEAMEKKEEKNE